MHYNRPLLTLINRYTLYERQSQQKSVKYESFDKENVKFMQTLKYIKNDHGNTYKHNKHNSSWYKQLTTKNI